MSLHKINKSVDAEKCHMIGECQSEDDIKKKVPCYGSDNDLCRMVILPNIV